MRYHIYWFPSLKQRELNFRLNRSLVPFVEFADTFHLQRREEQNTRTKQISFLVVGSHSLTTKISLRKTQHKHKILSRRHLCSLNYKKVQTKKQIRNIQKQEHHNSSNTWRRDTAFRWAGTLSCRFTPPFTIMPRLKTLYKADVCPCL